MPRRTYKPRRYRNRRAYRAGLASTARQSRFANRRYRYRISARGNRSLRFKKLTLGGFPSRKTVALRYVEDFTLNPGNGTTAVNVFRGNSIFDPNQSGLGHQPMFFDNYSQLYSRYKVNYATVTFICLSNHIVNTSTEAVADGTSVSTNNIFSANERAARMFILLDQDPGDYPSDLDNLIEEGNPKLKWKFAPQNTTGRMHKIRKKIYPHKLLNLAYRDDTLTSAVSGNPTSQIYAICGVDSMPGADSDTMRYQVIITYNVTFYDFIGNQTQN